MKVGVGVEPVKMEQPSVDLDFLWGEGVPNVGEPIVM